MQDVTLQVAVPSIRQEVNAFGIEMCHCPPEYEGLSCQNPAAGYYKKREDDFMDSSNVLDLIGISVPCQCYGHSNQCNGESGYCRVCYITLFLCFMNKILMNVPFSLANAKSELFLSNIYS